jgi:hypothetical protein
MENHPKKNRAMDKMAAQKGKNGVYHVLNVPEIPYCFRISVPESYPDMHRIEARRGKP